MDYILGQVCMFYTVLDVFCWMKEAFTHYIIEVCKNTKVKMLLL